MMLFGNTKKNTDSECYRHRNSGSAIVLVVVSVAFLAILATIIMYAAYINYKIKTIETRTNDNFYTGEMALEEVRAGLETEISVAYMKAYMEVMEHYNEYDETQRQAIFRSKFLNYFQNAICVTGDKTKVDMDILRSYLTQPSLVTLQIQPGHETDQSCTAYTTSLKLSYLECRYIDDKDYVSIIDTDMLIRYPELRFDDTVYLPDTLSFTMIADTGIEVTGGSGNSVKGSVYAGADGIEVTNSQVIFVDSQKLVSKGPVDVAGAVATTAMSTVTSNLWASDIYVEGKTLNLSGTTYVSDDLTISEKGSKVTVSGKYIGYGSETNSKGSSAILINGTGTKLDMSGLDSLALAGEAYIGINLANQPGGRGKFIPEQTAVDGTTVDDATFNDVPLGESIAVKKDQLAYLVPTKYFTPYKVSNPMSISDYKKLTAANRGDIKGKVSLEIPGATATPYFYQASSTNTWVYYYLVFADEARANAYFQSYFAENEEAFNAYVKDYLAEYKVPLNFGRLNLAGNAIVSYDNGTTFGLEPANLTAETNTNTLIKAEFVGYADMYTALCTNLTTNKGALGSAAGHTVYENLINEMVLKTMIAGTTATEGTTNLVGGIGKIRTYDNGTSTVLLIDNEGNGAYTVSGNADWSSNVHLIIATGDVVVTGYFDGLIIAKGTITINNNAKSQADAEEVGEILLTYKDVVKCFRDCDDLVDMLESATPATDKTVKANELISYINWSKN